MQNVEHVARQANSADVWARIWDAEGDDTWRAHSLSGVYTRVASLLRRHECPKVLDIGGGIGVFGKWLRDEGHASDVTVWEHSAEVVARARDKGLWARQVDLELDEFQVPSDCVVVSTEVIEHLSGAARNRLLASVSRSGVPFYVSVPNDRLGPEDEPQHTIKWTPLEFLQYLRGYWKDARVEVVGNYLLGVCGVPKAFKLSVTMPVRDEAEDLGRTLASFRAIADEIVIGVDPRTSDNTREVARKYAEVVFDLDEPQGPADERRPDKGVHFAWIRNQCIARCTGEWIFMSEGHEHLEEGVDVLLNLDSVVPDEAKVALVLRRIGTQQWGFPWLFRKDPTIKFIRHTHNSLDYPDGTYVVKLPQVATRHDRVHKQDLARAAQRKIQNRKSLMDDWLSRGSANSLYYLAAEWRGYDPSRSKEYFEEFLRTSRNGPQRYQARMELAAAYASEGKLKEAREHLHSATADDWTRTEHFIFLGDLAFEEGQFEQAYRMYRYAAVSIGKTPFTLWWIETSLYTFIPAQRLAMVCCELGNYEESLRWARRVVELLPEHVPEELRAECEDNVRKLEEALNVAA